MTRLLLGLFLSLLLAELFLLLSFGRARFRPGLLPFELFLALLLAELFLPLILLAELFLPLILFSRGGFSLLPRGILRHPFAPGACGAAVCVLALRHVSPVAARSRSAVDGDLSFEVGAACRVWLLIGRPPAFCLVHCLEHAALEFPACRV